MTMTEELIGYGREHNCSDIHLTYGLEPIVRCNGKLVTLSGYGVMDDARLQQVAGEILVQSGTGATLDESLKDIDLCYETGDGTRNRVNIFRQQKHIAVAIRLLNSHIPSLDELNMPEVRGHDVTMAWRRTNYNPAIALFMELMEGHRSH